MQQVHLQQILVPQELHTCSERCRWEPSDEAAPEVNALAGVPCIAERDSIVLLGGSKYNELGLHLAEIHQAIQMEAAQLLVHALYALGLLRTVRTLSCAMKRSTALQATLAQPPACVLHYAPGDGTWSSTILAAACRTYTYTQGLNLLSWAKLSCSKDTLWKGMPCFSEYFAVACAFSGQGKKPIRACF